MMLSLPEELEEFVQRTAASGHYPSPEAVVVEAVREFQNNRQDGVAATGRSPADETCPPELKSMLLEAVRGPHYPLPSDYFDQLRERLRVNKTK